MSISMLVHHRCCQMSTETPIVFFSPPISGVEHKLWLPSWLFVIINFTNILHSLPVRVNFSLGLIKSPVWLSGNRHLGTSYSPYCVQLLDCLVLWDPGYLELEYLHFLCFRWARIIQKKICLLSISCGKLICSETCLMLEVLTVKGLNTSW